MRQFIGIRVRIVLEPLEIVSKHPVMTSLLVGFALAIAVHVGGMACVATLLRVPYSQVSFGFGPRLARLSLFGVPIEFRALPLGGYVELRQRIEMLPWGQAVCLALCGNLLLLGFASILLSGAGAAAAEFLSSFRQLVGGVLSPFGYGQPLLSDYAERATESGLAFAVGVAFAKFAALNLVPLPMLNGGQLVLACLQSVRPVSPRVRARIGLVGSLLAVPVQLIWITIVVRWFIQAR